MNKVLFYFILIIGVGKSYTCLGQNERINFLADSLKTKTFEELKDKFEKHENDVDLARIYAKTYLEKAKRIGDTIKIADGYNFLGAFEDENLAMKYADSIIYLTNGLTHKEYPGAAYKLKGNLFFVEGKYNKAFDQYLIASEFAKKSGNELQYLTLKFNIGILKKQLGERNEDLIIFRDYVNYLINNNLKHNYNLYNKGLYALSDSYIFNEKLDSAEIYIKEGIVETLRTNDLDVYNLFVLQSGINNYFQDKYEVAIDSLSKAEKLLAINNEDDKVALAMCNYYMGKSLLELDYINNGIYHFKKVDTLLNEAQDIIPELLDAYDVLMKYYKSKNDDKNQLKYLESLLKFDSILEYNYKSLSNKIIRKYESKELLDKKNILINRLQEKTFFSRKLIIGFILLILVLLTIVFFVFRKNWIYKKRFQYLIDQTKSKVEKGNEESLKLATKNTNLPEELVKDILDKLKKFEESKKFLNQKYTLNSLAKELHTNSSYLSKIINETKQINFANYLNDLKVEEAIDRLTNEKRFRAYTIKTIANEVGFNTSQSFSLAFYKKTGIYPSYFIKKFENQ